MKVMGLGSSTIIDMKEQMLYIYNSYKTSRPTQSNLFRGIQTSYRDDMIVHNGDVIRQMDAIIKSLSEVYTRYGFTDVDVKTKYDELNREILLDITATLNGVTNKLSEALILESN